MKARISRLENSILSMISSSKSESSENTSDPQGSVGSVTNLEENDIEQAGGQRISVDTRSTHWDAILNEVSTDSTLYQPSLCISDQCVKAWSNEGSLVG
jgi:hypothetical protein